MFSRLMSLGLNNQVVYDQEIYNVTGRKCAVIAADM
uniref:Uridine phosphorylase n=1 Tax=Caenorhabditis tropicalis TaxID=1561998 RepID=A0A1I7SYS3_9PELO